MPMESNYFDQLKSSCADMKNTGGRWGGEGGAAAAPPAAELPRAISERQPVLLPPRVGDRARAPGSAQTRPRRRL